MVAHLARLHYQPASAAGLARALLGWLIVLGGSAALLAQTGTFFQSMLQGPFATLSTHALSGGLMAALATAVGALPVLFMSRISARAEGSLLGFSAGVMLAASLFSLLLPALEIAQDQGLSTHAALAGSALALLAGAAALFLLDRSLPHETSPQGPTSKSAIWLFVIAITVHNIPEGLAIGVAAALDDGGRAVATGISLQNLPEGLIVALALFSAGYRRWFAFSIAALSGIVEPLSALAAAVAVATAESILPWGLAAAAGAMLFVISHEIIPAAQRNSPSALASAALIVGFVVMMVLEQLLG